MASISLHNQETLQQENNKQIENPENKNIRHQKCENLTSSYLPKQKGWVDDYFYQYQGFWYEQLFLDGVLWAQENFRARSSDIILATFPKCGTTWLKSLMFSIMNRNQYYHDSKNKHPLLSTNPHKLVPYIETQVHEESPISYLDSLSSPRLLSTHIPYTSLPKSIIDAHSKIMCIVRDPKDVFVSMWIFFRNIRSKDLPPLTVEEAFESFINGVCLAGPIWDHFLGFWKANVQDPDNMLFLKYEDMKKDTLSNVKQLAEFLGRPFSLEEEKNGVIEEIMKLCSFEKLSKLEVNKNGVLSMGARTHAKVRNEAFFRKGEVGDSRNYLTAEMIQRLDKITKKKLNGSGLEL